MFRAEPLVKIHLHVLASEAADAALVLAHFGIYSPARHAPEALSEYPAAAYRETWLEAESRTAKLVERCGELAISLRVFGQRAAQRTCARGCENQKVVVVEAAQGDTVEARFFLDLDLYKGEERARLRLHSLEVQ